MPRIPMSDRGFVPHAENNVRMTGAPGMSFAMDKSQALNDTARVLEQLGQNALAITDSLVKYVEHDANIQNRLAATNAQNLYTAINEELTQKMAENPASFRDFTKWADDADKRYIDEVRQYTDQMTEPFRKQFEADMEGVRIKALSQRRSVAVQANATNKLNLMDAQLKYAAQRGDAPGYKKVLDECKGTLLTDEMYQVRLMDYDRLSDFYAVKSLVDAEDENILDKLKEKDSEGNFKNYQNLSQEDRDQFIRKAKADQIQRETEEEYRIRAEFNLGNIPTEDNLKTDLRTGQITNKQFVQQMALVKQYKADKEAEERRIKTEAKQAATAAEQSLKEAFEASHHLGQPMYSTQAELNEALKKGEISPASYNDFSEYLKRVENARKAAETEARQDATRKAEALRDSYKFDIIQMDFPNNPSEAYDLFKDTWDELKANVKDNKSLIDLYSTLKAQLDKGLKGEQDEFKTPEGKAVKKFIEDTYKNGTDFQGLYYDPNGLFNKTDDQTFMQARYYEIFEIARKMLNAGKTASEVTKEIQARVSQLNDGKIKNILGDMYTRKPAEEPITRASAPLMPH